jgi:hypothetical protein
MQHLKEEALARLVDEEAGEGEALHLELCGQCRGELEAMRGQTRALESLPQLLPPRNGWESLAARLVEEELVGVRPPRRGWDGWPLRAAAGLALFLGGTATGALALRSDAPPAPVAVSRPAPAAATPQKRLREAEAAYLAALTQYSQSSGASQTTDPLNRLAALEGIVLTTRAALEEAPADPLINGYHLSALGQRDAILRQIDATREPKEKEEQPWY